jgi:hypothetical protein
MAQDEDFDRQLSGMGVAGSLLLYNQKPELRSNFRIESV